MAISFFTHEVSVNLTKRRVLKHFIEQIFKDEGYELSALTYVFCSDEYLLSINKQFLNHNTYTDIITFPLSEKDNAIIGEVYISIDRVVENAGKYNTTVLRELHRVIFHGALHLCGFKDKSSDEAATMRSKEEFYLREYNIR